MHPVYLNKEHPEVIRNGILGKAMKKKRICYTCGKKSSNGKGDHVPPSSFFADIPECLMNRDLTFTCCASCNNEHNKKFDDVSHIIFTWMTQGQGANADKAIWRDGKLHNESLLDKLTSMMKNASLIKIVNDAIVIEDVLSFQIGDLHPYIFNIMERLIRGIWLMNVGSHCKIPSSAIKYFYMHDSISTAVSTDLRIEPFLRRAAKKKWAAERVIIKQPSFESFTWAHEFHKPFPSTSTLPSVIAGMDPKENEGFVVLELGDHLIIAVFGVEKYED